MYRLTDKRFESARPIFEKYRSILFRNQAFDTQQFEHELRKCWDLGYRELKDILIALAKNEAFVGVAAYYMEHSNAPGPCSEFKAPLAKLYGVTSYDNTPNLAQARDLFWQKHYRDNAKPTN